MVQQLPTLRELLKNQRQLAPNDQQSKVLLQFSKPIPRGMIGEFYRIQLTQRMAAGGEDEFYEAEIFQPHRVGPQNCPRCRQQVAQVSQTYTRCTNRSCELYGRTIVSGPRRGVVAVVTAPDFVVDRQMKDVCGRQVAAEYLDRAILVLDRRYHPDVLAAVYRTAGQLCDLYGWGLK